MSLVTSDLAVMRGTFSLGPVDLTCNGTGLNVLVGQNGAGKTTLLRLLTGLDQPSSGRITVWGHDVNGSGGDRRAALQAIGYVPQADRLPPRATLMEAWQFAGWLKRMRASDVRHRSGELLESLDLVRLSQCPVGVLSGGERQRVSIGTALLHDPRVLVMDEPTAGLDPIQRVVLHELLERLATDRLVMMSTHLADDITAEVSRVLALARGTMAFDGSVAELEAMGTDVDRGSSALERGLWSVLSVATDAA